MGLPPLSFTGFSSFSENLQALLERSFKLASLPIQNLQTEQTILLGRQQELNSLAADLRGLRDVFAKLGLAAAQGASKALSTNTSVATAELTGAAGGASSFDLNVTAAASAAQESALAGLPNTNSSALSADGFYRLRLGPAVTDINLLTIGSGRTAGTAGAATPDPKVRIGVEFSNGLTGSITAELHSFFVGSAAPSDSGAGDTVSVSFLSTAGGIQETVEVTLDGGEGAAALASKLNAAIAANAALNGKVSFDDEGGRLKLAVSDTAGTGFSFTSSSSGSVVSGLEAGGFIGGHSAEEIAAALNAQVALNSALTNAGVEFLAEDGEVRVKGGKAFNIDVTDFAEGTGFASGLAGAHSVAGYDNTLSGLRDFINAKTASLGVKATIINTSSDPAKPAYHLTLTANQTGATTLALEDSAAADLLSAANQGSDAIFTVNGLDVQNSSNLVANFAPGLAVTITGPGQTTVRVDDDQAGLSKALQDFAAQYNTVVSRIRAHVGEGAGVLSGDFLLREAQSTLRQITGFVSEGGVRSMAAIGLELDREGVLSFNASAFQTAAAADFAGVVQFLGGTVEGFAGNALKRLNSLADPVSGQIQTAVRFIGDSDQRLQKQIEAAKSRVDRMMENLEIQFAAADRILATLEAQQDQMKRLFEAQKRFNDR